jgi:hypothetical protein
VDVLVAAVAVGALGGAVLGSAFLGSCVSLYTLVCFKIVYANRNKLIGDGVVGYQE